MRTLSPSRSLSRSLSLTAVLLLAFAACKKSNEDITPPSGGGGGGTTGGWNWSSCAVDQRPIWFAYKDGDSDWTPVTGSGGQYSFTITSDKGGVAYVTRDSDGYETTNIQYKSAAELNAGFQVCASSASTIKMVSGTANGLSEDEDMDWFDEGRINLGPAAVGQAFAGDPSFMIIGSWNGPEDLFAYRSRFSFGGPPPSHSTDRCIIRRNQNPANGATLPAFNFNGTEAFAASTSTLSIIGGAPEQITMAYIASGDCLLKDGASVLYADIDVSSNGVIAGIPSARQVPGELHCLTILGEDDWIAQRLFTVMGPQTVQVPAMAAPAITPLSAGYARLQASYTMPATMYAARYGNTQFSYEETNGNKVSLSMSLAWLDAATVSSTPPEFDGLDGWDATWWPVSGGSGTWNLSVQSIDFDCHEEGTSFTLMKNGTY